METYHKIQTVYFRDPNNNFKTLLEGEWSKPEFELLKDLDWICTEKIDGTNIRIIWDGENVSFKGKTDKAILQKHLVGKLTQLFPKELMKKIFCETPACLYGEGYGVKIQKGGNYITDNVNFILFDITVPGESHDWILGRMACEEISEQLDIGIVPIIGIMKLEEAINFVRKGFYSTISQNKQYMAEGLICKPTIDLFSRSGQRIITKIKYKDFER